MKNILYLLLLFTLLSCNNKTITQETTVAIIPYNTISKDKVELIQKAVEKYYDVHVKVLKPQKLPKAAFVNSKAPRYRADSIINIQKQNIPDDADYVLGLTGHDISMTKRDKSGKVKEPNWKYNDFGIMGLAYCPGNSCVVSDFRLKNKNEAVQFGRFKKVVIHELGHNFGLPHCPDKQCVMTDAVERISTIDNAKPALCQNCRRKLDM